MSDSVKRILLGVSGGISAYKSCYLASLFVKGGYELEVVMTESARKFVGELSFSALTGKRVHVDMFDCIEGINALHIHLAEWADVIVVAPLTANTLGKISCGLADNLLTSTILASRGSVVLCPAMNVNMWSNCIVQENVKRLKELGFLFVGPVSGRLACGSEGIGRMAEPEEIFEFVEKLAVDGKVS